MQKVAIVRFFSKRGLVMLGSGILLIVVLLLLNSVGSEAEIITVNDDGPADFSSIQDAIDAANTWDTIYVYNGHYYENIHIDKTITLYGEDWNVSGGGILIEGSGTDVVNITADYVTFWGFRVLGGGNLISLYNSDSCSINYVNVTNADVGIYLYFSDGNNISNCIACGDLDYSILLNNSNNNEITYNWLEGNQYGVYLYNSMSNHIRFNNFLHNVGIQAYDDLGENENFWNHNYHSGGGNYWEDYTGDDLFSGPNQDILGSDGIGDVPYEIDIDSKDEYPFMLPFNISWDYPISDMIPPSTTDDYDGMWHNQDFFITLTSWDDKSGVNETYYRINGGPIQKVSANGQPLISTESDNNTLEYWSIDNESNQEKHNFLYNIKLDKAVPSTSVDYDGIWHSSDFMIILAGFDDLSGIENTYYKLNNGTIKTVSADGQINITIENANNTLEYWSIDNAGNEETHKFHYEIKLDKTSPSTTDDYNGLWYTSDFTITLSALDNISGVNETYYLINGGPLKMVSIDGQPFITTESSNNAIEYWSVDIAGNEEAHKFLYEIRLDKTAPSTTDDYDGLWHYFDFIITLESTDELSGLDDTYYRINNGDIYSLSVDGQPEITTEGENNTLEYWSADIAGNIEEYNFLYGIKLNKTYPDLSITSEDIKFSKSRLFEESEVYINATIHNLGNLGATATVKFYDGEPETGFLIASKTIYVAAHDSNLASTLWNMTLGDHNIYVLIEDSIPEEPFTDNNIANKIARVEIHPFLVLSVGDLNVFRFESGEERTVPVYVSSYNNSAVNVRLLVLDDRGLNITVVTPPQNISKDGSHTFYLRIKAPVLDEGQEYREEDILLQVVSDETSSNLEYMDIIVGRAAAELFLWFVVIGGAAAGAGTLGFLGGTEIGKYALFAAAMSLYTRLSRKDVEDQETRGMIRGYILANPGEHYNAIKRALGLKNGNLAYHLKTLEKEKIVKSARDGRYKRFYPPGMKIPNDMLTLNKIQEIILGEIIKAPGISQKELAEIVGLSTSTINYHIGVMTNAGFVRVERKGKHTMCHPGNGVA